VVLACYELGLFICVEVAPWDWGHVAVDDKSGSLCSAPVAQGLQSAMWSPHLLLVSMVGVHSSRQSVDGESPNAAESVLSSMLELAHIYQNDMTCFPPRLASPFGYVPIDRVPTPQFAASSFQSRPS